jgi:LmbE family N-acetylglucosaminyl deacetylase
VDDAVFSAWSVLRAPGEVRVVNVFDGVPPPGPAPRWDRITGSLDRAEAMRARLVEDRAALALAGRDAVGLGLLELQYRDGPGCDAVDEALAEAARGASTIYAPAGIGGHADHLLVRNAALELATREGVALCLYADLPYAVKFGWPHWVTGAEPEPHLVPDAAWQPWLEAASPDGESLRPRPVALDERDSALKLEAMRAYRSQFAACNGGPLDQLADPRVLRFELLWEVS